MKGKFSVVGVGAPIVDLLARVDDDFLSGVRGEKGGMVMVDAIEMGGILKRLGRTPMVKTPGGSAANTLFDLAHFGVPTALLGTVGDDEDGKLYRERLAAAGGSTHALRTSGQAPTARCLCLVTPDAERTMRPALAASLEFDPGAVTEKDFAGYTLAHVEGYVLAHPEPKVAHLLATARGAGCRISLDLASFEIVNAFRPAILRLLEAYVDVAFANSDEADALFGAQPPEMQLAALRKLVPAAVVKLGERGAWADCGDGAGAAFVPAQRVPAVDTTAAGDSFAAGFLYGLLSGWDARRCGELGAAVAAETVQVVGAALPVQAWDRLRGRLAE